MGTKKLIDELKATAKTAQPKDDGRGTRWEGGHATTSKDGDLYNHHSKDHRTGEVMGWDYNTQTGEGKFR